MSTRSNIRYAFAGFSAGLAIGLIAGHAAGYVSSKSLTFTGRTLPRTEYAATAGICEVTSAKVKLSDYEVKPAETYAVKSAEESEEDSQSDSDQPEEYVYTGAVLNSYDGVNHNAFGNKETYYNLPMGGVVAIMRSRGFNEDEYPYWVREDGVKMLGPYVMVAADLSIYPRGSEVNTSLGKGLVCDTGDFIYENNTQFDIAVTW